MSYFVRTGEDTYDSTVHTTGPWNRESQHGGPPSALLGTRIDAGHPREDAQVVRFTAEILRPVPVGPLRVSTQLERGGRSVELLSGSLWASGAGAEVEVMRASVWRIRKTDLDLSPILPPYLPVDPPESGSSKPFFPDADQPGYLSSMEWLFVRGEFLEYGPSAAWARMRMPLVDGEPIPPLARVLAIADSGNGISSSLDFSKWLFINPDLTVTLRRLPVGEWVCLDAATGVEPNGIGLAESVLHDEAGPIGRGLQTLLIAPR